MLRVLVNQAAQQIVLEGMHDHGESIAHIDLHVHHTEDGVRQVLRNQFSHIKLLEALVATQAELSARLDALLLRVNGVSEQLTKVQAEIIAQVAALRALLDEAQGTTPEVDAKLAEVEATISSLKSVTDAMDDMNPDVGVDPPVDPDETPAQAQARRARS